MNMHETDYAPHGVVDFDSAPRALFFTKVTCYDCAVIKKRIDICMRHRIDYEADKCMEYVKKFGVTCVPTLITLDNMLNIDKKLSGIKEINAYLDTIIT